MKPLRATSSLSYRVKLHRNPFNRRNSRSISLRYTTLGRILKAPSGCSGAVPPADTPAPPPITAWRRLRKPDPSVIPALTTAAPNFAASYLPPARHGLPQMTVQRSPPDEHPPQPAEPWCSSRPEICRRPAIPFSGRPRTSGIHLHTRANRQSATPDNRGYQVQGRQEIHSLAVVPGCDSAPLFQFVEGPFYQVPLPGQLPVILPRVAPV